MDYDRLKKTVRKIGMSDEMKDRIIQNCKAETADKTEENKMSKNKVWFKKSISIATAAAICLCFTVGAIAAENFGFFKDITNRSGAIIGTQYEQATHEITVNITADEKDITIDVTMVNPYTAPYNELETLGLGNYKIIDTAGNVVIEGESTEATDVINGEATIKISLSNPVYGEYKLIVDSFIGYKKAEQPLRISGNWTCLFST